MKDSKNSMKKSLQNILLGILSIVSVVFFAIGYIKDRQAIVVSEEYEWKWQLELRNEEKRISELNFYGRLKESRDVKILVLGDSIGQGYSKDRFIPWISKLSQWIKDEYNANANITNIAQGETTVYYGLNEYLDIREEKFDLVLICFGKYDMKRIDESLFRGAYEELIINIKESNKSADIIPIIEHGIKKDGGYYKTITRLASEYDLDVANVEEKFAAENISIDGGINLISDDNTHPNSEGYDIYFKAVRDVIKNNVNRQKKLLQTGSLVYEESKNFKNHTLISNYVEISDFISNNNELYTNKKGATIDYIVNGDIIGISYLATEGGGRFDVYINGELYKKVDTNSSMTWNDSMIIASNIKEDSVVEIVSTSDKPITIFGITCSQSYNTYNEKQNSEDDNINNSNDETLKIQLDAKDIDNESEE